MFLKILKFELKYRAKRPATWAYFGILLVLGFILSTNGANAGSEKAFVNSAVTVTALLGTVSLFGILIASAVMGVPVYRDIEHGVKDYYFTYPVNEKSYLMGRYMGSLITLLLISLGIVFGLMIGYALGPVLGWEEPERFGPLRIGDYVNATLLLLWPNLILAGTIFFCLVALTRKIFVLGRGAMSVTCSPRPGSSLSRFSVILISQASFREPYFSSSLMAGSVTPSTVPKAYRRPTRCWR